MTQHIDRRPAVADADALARAVVAAMLDDPDADPKLPGSEAHTLLQTVAHDLTRLPPPETWTLDALDLELRLRAPRATLVVLAAAQIAVAAIRAAEDAGAPMDAVRASLVSPYRV